MGKVAIFVIAVMAVLFLYHAEGQNKNVPSAPGYTIYDQPCIETCERRNQKYFCKFCFFLGTSLEFEIIIALFLRVLHDRQLEHVHSEGRHH